MTETAGQQGESSTETGTEGGEGQTTTSSTSTEGGQGEGQGQGSTETSTDTDSAEVKELKAALAAQRKQTVDERKRADAAERKGMTEAEQAIATARAEARSEALGEVAAKLAEATFRTAIAGKQLDADAILNLAGDMRRFVGDDGEVDDKAIGEAVDGFAKLAGPGTGTGQTVRKGVGENGGGQLDGNAWMRGVLKG